MAKSITLTNSTGNKLIFPDARVQTMTIAKNNKLFQQALPGASEDQSIVVNLGVEGSRDFAFKLLDDGTDISEGNPGSIITLQQQINYISDTFFGNDPEEKYTMATDTTYGSLTTVTVVLDNMSLDISGLNPLSVPGRIKLNLGGGSQ